MKSGNFFSSLKEGQKLFGEDIAMVINSFLLSFVYLVGVGMTFIAARLFGKKFLQLKSAEQSQTYWESLNLTKQPIGTYYRQF